MAPGHDNIGVKLAYVTEDGAKVEEDFDLLVLSVGLEAPQDALALAEKFGICLDHHNFVKTGSFAPVATNRDGVYVCGAFRSPKAIPRSVTEASAAASGAARSLVAARGTLTREKTYPPERDVSQEEVRTGRVFVCSCGINIAGVVDVKAVSEYARSLPAGRTWRTISSPVPPTPRNSSPKRSKNSSSTALSWPPAPPGPTNRCFRTPCGRRA